MASSKQRDLELYRSLTPTFDDPPREVRLRIALPPRLNARYSANRATGGLYVTRSARQAEKALVDEIARTIGRPDIPILRGALTLTYTITPRDRRLPDIDAFEKSLFDVLTEAGVWWDDKQVATVSKQRLAPNPADPHIDITITESGLSFDDGCLFH